jgi:hypothetical protein
VQDGRHVTDFPYAGAAAPPVPGRASGDNRYLLAGAEYGIGPLTLATTSATPTITTSTSPS